MANTQNPTCPYCATSLVAEARFCPECGECVIEEVTSPLVQEAEVSPTPPPAPAPHPEPSVAPPEPIFISDPAPTLKSDPDIPTKVESEDDDGEIWAALSRYNKVYIDYPIVGQIFMYASMLLVVICMTAVGKAWDIEWWYLIPMLFGAVLMPISTKVVKAYIVLDAIQLALLAILIYIDHLVEECDFEALYNLMEDGYYKVGFLWVVVTIAFASILYLVLKPLLRKK